VLAAAGLEEQVSFLVASEDVERGKPHPDGYERAVALLDVQASEVLVLEDTEAGVAAAKAAGTRAIAVLGTLSPERLEAADEIVPAVNVSLIRRLLG
jgi:beta-phosphoglucomutase-like phosphatase (HAD superfamily)